MRARAADYIMDNVLPFMLVVLMAGVAVLLVMHAVSAVRDHPANPVMCPRCLGRGVVERTEGADDN